MDPIVLSLIIVAVGVVMHGIFTGLALVATWYFGHVAEKKILDEAKAIHKEVTDKIAEMDKAEAEYDKIDAFMEKQQEIFAGYRREITKTFAQEMGSMFDERMKQINTPGSPLQKQSTADRLLAMGETVIGVMAQQALEG